MRVIIEIDDRAGVGVQAFFQTTPAAAAPVVQGVGAPPGIGQVRTVDAGPAPAALRRGTPPGPPRPSDAGPAATDAGGAPDWLAGRR
jgi:hypothetical protein